MPRPADLPNLSPRLGLGWSSNGDFLTPAIHPFRDVEPTRGPTITAAIDLLDGAYRARTSSSRTAASRLRPTRFCDAASSASRQRSRCSGSATLLPLLDAIDVLRHIMPWFAQARDAADGRLLLKTGQADPRLGHHRVEDDDRRRRHMHQKLAQLTGGHAADAADVDASATI